MSAAMNSTSTKPPIRKRIGNQAYTLGKTGRSRIVATVPAKQIAISRTVPTRAMSHGVTGTMTRMAIVWLAEESPIRPLSTPCASRISDNSGQVSPSVMAIDSAAARQTNRLRRRAAGLRANSVMAAAADQPPSENGLKLVSRS